MSIQLHEHSFDLVFEQWSMHSIERVLFIFAKNKNKGRVPFGHLIKANINNFAKEEPCQVCLETNGNMYTACNHGFCEPCIKQWYKKCATKQFSCPMCRSPIAVLYKEYQPVDVNSLD